MGYSLRQISGYDSRNSIHSTKEGKFRGGNEYAHEVDVIMQVEPGLAKASGRFNSGGEMKI